jgi:eukaryotic-like serine/threonine-protein kinase
VMSLSIGSKVPAPVVRTKFFETAAQLSPDGNWLAYQSNESGTNEIYVDAFPQGGAKLKISTDGGIQPRWRGDGREVFYAVSTPNSLQMFSVSLTLSGAVLDAGAPLPLFQFPYLGVTHRASFHPYAVSADGRRFLVSRVAAEEIATTVEVVLNWNAEVGK